MWKHVKFYRIKWTISQMQRGQSWMYATKQWIKLHQLKIWTEEVPVDHLFMTQKKNRTFNQNETLHLNFDIVLMRSGGLIAQESVILIIFSENSKTTNNIISVIKIVPKNKLNDWTEKTASWNLNVAIDSRHSKKTQRKRENISSIDDRICFYCTEK